MPSKQQLAKRRKNKKTPVDKRSASKIYAQLPTLKPISREYIGHNQGFHYGLIDPKLSTESRMKIIEMEMKPIDKDYMDLIKKYIDEALKIQEMVSNKKIPFNGMTKKILAERVRRVLEYANMKMIYDRQQELDGLLSQLKF